MVETGLVIRLFLTHTPIESALEAFRAHPAFMYAPPIALSIGAVKTTPPVSTVTIIIKSFMAGVPVTV